MIDMPHIDWVDLSGKLVIVFVVIMLQRLIKDMLARQAQWNQQFFNAQERQLKIHAANALISSIRSQYILAKVDDRIKLGKEHLDATYARFTISEWDKAAEALVENEVCKDNAEAQDLLTDIYMMDKKELEKKVREYDQYIKGLEEGGNFRKGSPIPPDTASP